MPWPLHLALSPLQKVHGVPPLHLLLVDGLVALHKLSATCISDTSHTSRIEKHDMLKSDGGYAFVA